MAQTLVDLVFKASTSELDAARDKLAKVGDEAKKAAGQGDPVKSAFEKMSGGVRLATTAFLAAGAAVVAVGVQLMKMRDEAIEAADKMNDLANRTNIATERLTLLDEMAKMAGSSAEELVQSAEKLAGKLSKQNEESGRATNALKILGVSMKDANGEAKSMIQLQEDIVMAADQAADKNRAEAAAVALLGTEYYKLRTPIKEAAEQKSIMYDYMLKTNALISGSLAKNADDYNDKVSKLGLAFKGMGNSIAEWALPGMIKFIEWVTKAAEEVAKLTRQLLLGKNAVEGTSDKLADLTKQRDASAAAIAKMEASPLFNDQANGPSKALVQERERYQKLNDEIREYTRLNAGAAKAAEDVKKATTDGKKDEGPRSTFLGTGKTSAPADSDAISKLKQQEDALIRLRAEYEALYGVEKRTSTEIVEAAIARGDYNQKLDETNKVVKKAATEQELARLRANAANEDYLDSLVKITRATQQAKEAADKEIQSSQRQVEMNRIKLRIAKDVFSTQDDYNVAAAEYDAHLAEEAYVTGILNGLNEEKLVKLREEMRVKKQMLEDARTQKADNDADTGAQKGWDGFTNGWSKAFKQYKDDAENTAKLGQKAFESASGRMGDALNEFVMTGKLNFKSLVASILADLARIAMQKAIVSAMSMFANGGAFSGGTQFFATGGVVSSPTAFPMAGGRTGVMGEEGPEAIMPLKRGPDGKLGVAGAGGGRSVQNNYNVEINIGSVDSNERAAALQRELRNTIIATTRETMVKEQRKGGLLNPVGAR